MRIKPTLTLLSLVLLCFVSVTAQVSEKEKADKEVERRQALEKKTLTLLDEIVGDSWSLKSTENRVYVLTNVAEAIWSRDETRARNLFLEAFNQLNATATPAVNNSTAKSSPIDRGQIQAQYSATFAQRHELLVRVARHDPQFALELLRSIRLAPPEQMNARFRLPDESDLEQEIAAEAMARNPEQALRIARESLAKGLNFRLLGILFRLGQQSPEKASEFAGDIIEKIRTTNLESDPYALQMLVQLLRMARTDDLIAGQTPRPGDSKPLGLSDDQKRELVELVIDAALGATPGPNLVYSLRLVIPEIERFDPDRAPQVKKKIADYARSLPKEEKDREIYSSLFDKGNPEEMIKAGESVGGETRDSLYQQAVLMAVMRGKADGLRDYVKSHVSDESRRNDLLDLVDAEQISFAADRGKTEELEKLLSQIRLKEQRGQAMTELAILLEKKGDHDGALKLLRDAQGLIKIDLDSPKHTNALMMFVAAYALVDPDKAFAIIEPIVDRANSDVAKLLLLDRIVKSGVVKKGEILLNASGIMPVDFLVFKYGEGLTSLAKADFNRTKGVADRLERPELRLMARLMIARTLLGAGKQGTASDQR